MMWRRTLGCPRLQMSVSIYATDRLSGMCTNLKVFEEREDFEYVLDLEAQGVIFILQDIDRALHSSIVSLLFI
jgi:hypothetical protein